MKRVLAAAAFWASVFPASGQDSGPSCAKVDDADRRLLCYDAVFRTTVTAEPMTGDKGKWTTRIETSKIADTKDVYINLRSDDTFRGKYGGSEKHADLLIRCMENKTTTYFTFGDHFLADVQDYGGITFRVDDKKAEKKGFVESTDHSALGLWGGAAVPFIKNLLGGKQLVVRVTPFSESPLTTTFDIRGLDEAIKPIRAACKW